MSDVGNPLLNQPPDQVSVSGVAAQEVDPAAAATLGAFGVIASGVIEHFFGIRAASMVDSAATITAILTGNWDKMLALVGKFFTAAQGEQNSGFYDLCAAVLEDLTGVKVDASQLKNSAFGSGRLAGMQTFGADLFKLLQEEFAPQNGATIGPDTGPAERFLGFLMNFAIRQGNVAAMCEALPQELKFLTGFRDYGEQMAKQLGLGRLARRGLTPLVTALVANPLTWQLNTTYRPTRIAKEQAIKKFFRQPEFKAQMMTELAQEGFSDDRIQDLIDDATPLLEDRQIIDLFFRFGNALDATKSALSQRGWGVDETQQLIDLQRPLLEKTEITALYAHGAMSQSDAMGYLSKLGYDPTTAQLVLQAHTFGHTHTPVLHFGELKRLVHENQIDVLEFQQRLAAQGYNTDDINLLTLDALTNAPGKPKIPSLAVMKAAYKAGKLESAAALGEIERLGYSKDDAAFILSTWPGPAKPAATTPTGSTTG